MEKKVKAIPYDEKLCFKCLKKHDHINVFSLYRSEYGSSFDNNYTKLQLCNKCKPIGIEIWFNESPEMFDYCADYKHEKDIINFVNSLPIEGQELFWNRCAYGACASTMDSQDWIDMELGILPDEKYEQYGMYSPRQIKAYKERFPTCEYPFLVLWEDNSKSCWCPFNAFGDYENLTIIPEKYNISQECYECKYYKLRETPLKEIKQKDMDDYQEYMRSKIKSKEYSRFD